jgi:S-adenosylhomocysteine hydrolase
MRLAFVLTPTYSAPNQNQAASAPDSAGNDGMAKNGKGLKPAVYEFPKELDQETAAAKLETMGIRIDEWTPEQEAYARAYNEGT